MNQCHECSSELQEVDAFCPFCGISIQPVEVVRKDDDQDSESVADHVTGESTGLEEKLDMPDESIDPEESDDEFDMAATVVVPPIPFEEDKPSDESDGFVDVSSLDDQEKSSKEEGEDLDEVDSKVEQEVEFDDVAKTSEPVLSEKASVAKEVPLALADEPSGKSEFADLKETLGEDVSEPAIEIESEADSDSATGSKDKEEQVVDSGLEDENLVDAADDLTSEAEILEDFDSEGATAIKRSEPVSNKTTAGEESVIDSVPKFIADAPVADEFAETIAYGQTDFKELNKLNPDEEPDSAKLESIEGQNEEVGSETAENGKAVDSGELEAVSEIEPEEGGSSNEESSEEEIAAVGDGAVDPYMEEAEGVADEISDVSQIKSETTPNIGVEDTDGSNKTKLKPLAEGTVLNSRYEIVRKIGGGGMGAVYLANDQNLGGVLRAVKEMVQSYIEEEQQDKAINDFKRESMLLTSLEHSSIPTIYDYFFDEKEGRFYLVMKYISGGDLAGRLRAAPEGRIDEKLVVEWGIQIADVLDYLHSRQPPIVYRDLKPANVMIDGNSDRIMLIDFGIARWVNKEEKGVTAVGTMGYAPPELFSGNVEPRSDIYSLGSTMFHLLTGADPQSNPLLIFDFQKHPRPRPNKSRTFGSNRTNFDEMR